MLKIAPIFLLVLALAGCNRGGTSVAYDANGGQTINIIDSKNGNIAATIGPAAQLPSDLPAWAPAYPGSTVLVAQDHAAGTGGGLSSLKNVLLSTPDKPAKVAVFYDQKIAQAGVKPMQSTNDGDTVIRLMQTPAGMGSVSVTKDDDSGGSSISITYNMHP